MILYKKLIRCRAIEICDPHIVPDEHYSDWFNEGEITNEDLINQMKDKYGDMFSYYVQEMFVPVKHKHTGCLNCIWFPCKDCMVESKEASE